MPLESESWLTKYRPETWDEVVGHEAVVNSLRQALKRKAGSAFLLTGPSGTGKTTIARIVAREVGCEPRNLLEIDAATYTGIDSMRQITEALNYAPLGDSSIRVIIIDEAHALSAQAWKALSDCVLSSDHWQKLLQRGTKR